MRIDTVKTVRLTIGAIIVTVVLAVVGCSSGNPVGPEPEPERPIKCILVMDALDGDTVNLSIEQGQWDM